jgi:hypothetical protein
MKTTPLFRSLILAAALLAVMLCGSVARADIAIQFVGGINGGQMNTPMAPSEVAGAVIRQMNWNPIGDGTGTNAKGGDIALMDDQGNSSGATLEWFSGNNWWAVPIVDSPGDIRLMRGYLDSSDQSTTIVIVSGIPYATYDVYLYSRGDGGSDRQGLFYVNDLELDNPQPIFNPGGLFFIGDYVLGQNYAVFPGQTGGSDLIVFATADPNFPGGGFRAPLNGVQIVNTSGTDLAGTNDAVGFQLP